MKHNICGFSQEKLIEYGLDYSDALILQEIKDFYATGRMVSKEIDGKEYFWVKYSMLIDSLPVLGLKTRDGIYRRMKKLVSCGVLEHKTLKRNGTYSFFCFGKAMPALLWSGGATSHPTGCGSKQGGGTDENKEQKTLLTKDSCSTVEKNCDLSLEKKEPATATSLYSKEFLEFWSAYPNKKNKGGAWKAWRRLQPPLDTVLLSLEIQKSDNDWVKENGKYIPHPQTWLNNTAWEDEVEFKPFTQTGITSNGEALCGMLNRAQFIEKWGRIA